MLKGSRTAAGDLELATFFARQRGATIDVKTRRQGTWAVQVDGDLSNCEVPTVDSGDWLTFEAERHWIGFARIASARAPLFNAPRGDARSKAYLVRDDVVAMLEQNASWVKIDYFQLGGDFVRWMDEGDLSGE